MNWFQVREAFSPDPGSLVSWASRALLTGAVWVTPLVLPGRILFLDSIVAAGPGKSYFSTVGWGLGAASRVMTDVSMTRLF